MKLDLLNLLSGWAFMQCVIACDQCVDKYNSTKCIDVSTFGAQIGMSSCIISPGSCIGIETK